MKNPSEGGIFLSFRGIEGLLKEKVDGQKSECVGRFLLWSK